HQRCCNVSRGRGGLVADGAERQLVVSLGVATGHFRAVLNQCARNEVHKATIVEFRQGGVCRVSERRLECQRPSLTTTCKTVSHYASSFLSVLGAEGFAIFSRLPSTSTVYGAA